MTTSSLNTDDPRFTLGLLHDVARVLEAHGYRQPPNDGSRYIALGRTLTALLALTRAYTGTDIHCSVEPHTLTREAAPNAPATDGW